jgi:general secretion pathway protein I
MSRFHRKRRSERSGGFTLVEVLVALVIAAVALQTAFMIFADESQRVEDNKKTGRAIALAESKLDGLCVTEPLTPGRSQGTFDGDFIWELSAQALASQDAHPRVVPMEVDLTVSWQGGLHRHQVEIQTVKLTIPQNDEKKD